MIDGLRDLLQGGKALVVEADNWTDVERKLRKEGIQFWGWQRFNSSDGGDVACVSVPSKDYERAVEIAGMTDSNDKWGWATKLVVILVIVAIVAFVLMGGAA